MNFEPTPTQHALLEQVQAIMAEHCSPQSEEQRDRTAKFPSDLLLAMGHIGLFRLWLEPRNDAGFLDACLVQERLAYSSATAAAMLFINCVALTLMKRGGVDDRLLQVFNEGAAGKTSFAFAMTEPGAGSDATAMATCALKSGDHYILNGCKSYVTGAMDAQNIVVVARTRPDLPAKTGTSIFCVPASAAGLRMRRLNKLAGDSLATCELIFTDVQVPQQNLVGQESAAWNLLFFGGLIERLLVAAMSIGLARRAFDEVRNILSSRVQFDQQVTEFQAVQHQLADMACEIQAMTWMTRHAAWLADQGGDCAMQINMAKLFSSEWAARLTSEAMRLSGGRGYFVEDVLNRTFREAGLGLFAGGSSELQRNGIARALGFGL